MREVVLRMKEQYKYEIIKKLVDTNGNKKKRCFEIALHDPYRESFDSVISE